MLQRQRSTPENPTNWNLITWLYSVDTQVNDPGVQRGDLHNDQKLLILADE